MFCGYLRQSTAVTVMVGPFVDDMDGKTPETALTITQAEVRLSKNAANIAQKGEATSLTHDELGLYTCPLNTTDTDTLGLLTLAVVETGALPIRQDYLVLPAGEWDARFAATGAIPNMGVLARGTAQSATATGLRMAAGETHGDDTLIGATVLAFGSTQGYWQSRQITDSVGATDDLTVDTWTVTPSGTITYVVLGSAPASASAPPQVALVDNAITAAKIAGDAITAAKVAADVHTESAAAAETAIFAHSFGAKWNNWTFKQLVKTISAAVFGKGVGFGTTSVQYRNAADDGNVISATGVDADGNRGTITVTPDA